MGPKLAAILAATALALGAAACGDDDSDDVDTTTDPETEAEDTAEETAPAPDGAVVQTATTDLGEILVDSEGLTLYGFTEDTDGVPTCDDECAVNWPPLTLDGDELPEGLDPSVFSVAERSDGSFQLVAGDWPLYFFAGDSEPGDVNGQDVGDVWFVVSPEGDLIGAPGSDTGTGDPGADDTEDDDNNGY